MRARPWRGRIWAARLGLLALALNALVPVHLAFDLAEAFEPAQHCGTHVEAGGAERRLLAMLSGHPEADGTSDEHGKHHACPVCGALAPGRLCPARANGAVGLSPVGPANGAFRNPSRTRRRSRRLPLPRSSPRLSLPILRGA